jgi:hypothetical protein
VGVCVVYILDKIILLYLHYSVFIIIHTLNLPMWEFLDTFKKFWKMTLQYPFACPHEKAQLQLDGFSWNWYLGIFHKFIENQVSLILVRIMCNLHDEYWTFVITSCWIVIIIWNNSVKICSEYQNSIICSTKVFQILCHLGSNADPDRPH